MTDFDIMPTYRQLLSQGENILQQSSIEDFRFDALQILLDITGFSNSEWLLKNEQRATQAETERFFRMIERRSSHEPLQYILGKWSFYESEFFVGDGVLIPRPETEELVEICISFITKNNCRVVYDLCTGSGCIGLSLAEKYPEVSFLLFDYYDKALSYCRKNAGSLCLKNVRIIKQDILMECSEDIPTADLIVSNPPYIRTDEIPTLKDEVLREPVTALDGGDDGLVFYRAIKDIWTDKLNDNGMLALECGEKQSSDISLLFSDIGKCEAIYDTYGADRFVTIIKNSGG